MGIKITVGRVSMTYTVDTLSRADKWI